MRRWITTTIQWQPCRVWKGTGSRPRDGYELSSPLAYCDRYGRTWRLDPGYVWDGPSYPGLISWFVGKREKDALLAASAFHDLMGAPVTLEYPSGEYKEVKISIRTGARLYQDMIADWPDSSERPNALKRLKQRTGLLLGQRFFRLLSPGGLWQKAPYPEPKIATNNPPRTRRRR